MKNYSLSAANTKANGLWDRAVVTLQNYLTIVESWGVFAACTWKWNNPSNYGLQFVSGLKCSGFYYNKWIIVCWQSTGLINRDRLSSFI